MRNEKLNYILNQINLPDCLELVKDNIYYSKRSIKQRCLHMDGSYTYITGEYEFLIIAQDGIKKAIILRCGEQDLHWYVKRKWRGSHVLSSALQTGIIHKIWPENTSITCCYNPGEDYGEKYTMTQHLADIAGLSLDN